MDALCRGGWMDALSRGEWMDGYEEGWLDGFVK